jgi:tryptophanyl-tRNA synthetase
MAADILMFKAHKIPVGRDQVQHVEMARDIANSFNHLYGELLVAPEAQIDENVALLPGLDGRKMSKSYGNAVFLSDTPKEIDQKLSRMITDPARARRTDPGEPEKCPAFQLHKIYSTDAEIAEVSKGCRSAGIGCLDCKKIFIKHVIDDLGPFREKRAQIENKPQEVDDVLHAGNQLAQRKATETMIEVRETLGL